MKNTVIILTFLISFSSLANVNNFTLKLDQFTIAKSQLGLNDTIDITKAAWTTSDSLHLSAYICGRDYSGVNCQILGRDTENKLFEMYFDNKGLAIEFSIPTSRIDPDKVKILALSMGATSNENRMGVKYRMGILRFM